jgi:hydrogenase expression/formation protein HypE
MEKEFVTLSQGSGGSEMQELIKRFAFSSIAEKKGWKNCDSDSATLDLGDGKSIVFTTDSFIVDPISFPGGDIGHIAMCGTINDLSVMGARPLGISLGVVMEEGFPIEELDRIISSIDKVSKSTGIPVVTGDTKVMQKGKLDRILINTSGVGIVDNDILRARNISIGDKIIISGGLGEHAVALLSKRFDYTTDIISDSKPVIEEMDAIRDMVKIAKDPTRGGIASILNELCEKHNVSMLLYEEKVPAKAEVRKVVEMLGINLYELACEGRIVCIVSPKNASIVEEKLKSFNRDAAIIGEITQGNLDGNTEKNKVIIQTFLGKRILPMPTGTIVPRIC